MIARAERLILPGIGAFDRGMKNLHEHGLVEPLRRRVLEEGAPLLGLCLGAQLLTRASVEGQQAGLGWVEAETVPLAQGFEEVCGRLKVPHVGWNFTYRGREHPLLEGLEEPARFYFVHSFKLLCDDPADVLLRTRYGEVVFTSGFARGNVVGVQFHPEKSHRYGKTLLANFAGWTPGEAA